MRQDCLIEEELPPQTMGVFPSKPPTERARVVSKSPKELQVKLGLARSITSVDGPDELANFPPTTRNLFAVKMILQINNLAT